MPLANGRYTTYKVVAIPFSLDNPNLTPGSIDASAAGWTYLMASDVNIQQSMPISSVKLNGNRPNSHSGHGRHRKEVYP